MQKIGIFGGTFNPFHLGHIFIAEFFFKNCCLDKCIFVPSFISPFKINSNLVYEDNHNQLAILNLALENFPNFFIDDFEISRREISYTYLTIEHFLNMYPDDELYLLIGSDQAEKFHLWKNWEFILESTTLAIANRNSDINSEFQFQKDKPNCQVICLKNPIIDISSTQIRYNIKNGIDCSKLLNQKVYQYILKNNLYR